MRALPAVSLENSAETEVGKIALPAGAWLALVVRGAGAAGAGAAGAVAVGVGSVFALSFSSFFSSSSS